MNRAASFDRKMPMTKEISDTITIVVKIIDKSVLVIFSKMSKTAAAEPVLDFPIV